MKLAAITRPPLASCALPVGRISHQELLQRHREGRRICDSAVSCYAKEQWEAQGLLVCSLEGLDVHTHATFGNAAAAEDLGRYCIRRALRHSRKSSRPTWTASSLISCRLRVSLIFSRPKKHKTSALRRQRSACRRTNWTSKQIRLLLVVHLHK